MQPPLVCSSTQQAPESRSSSPIPAPDDVEDRNQDRSASKRDSAFESTGQDYAGEAETTDRPIRNCQHHCVRHEHGTRVAYVADRCRCLACTDANRRDAKRRRTAIAYGKWTGMVDAAPSRAHIAQLRATGLSLQGIAAQSGVGYGTIARIIYGDPSRKQPPNARVRTDTQRRLLEVRIETVELTDRSRIDAAGTRRRLQGLAALGWPLPTLALRLGRSPGNLSRTLTAATVTVANARAIAALYDTLHDTLPPTRTPSEQAAAAKTRAQATHAGWLPPLAWDDIDSDQDAQVHHFDEPNDDHAWLDEIAVERAMNGDRVRLTRLERDEAIARLTRRGVSARCIAELLGTSSRNVVRRRRAQRAVA